MNPCRHGFSTGDAQLGHTIHTAAHVRKQVWLQYQKYPETSKYPRQLATRSTSPFYRGSFYLQVYFAGVVSSGTFFSSAAMKSISLLDITTSWHGRLQIIGSPTVCPTFGDVSETPPALDNDHHQQKSTHTHMESFAYPLRV